MTRKMVLSIAAAVAFFALAAPAALPTPAAAQAGCNPYIGGSCGFQDTHPPVGWRGQHCYYNGQCEPRGARRGRTIPAPGGYFELWSFDRTITRQTCRREYWHRDQWGRTVIDGYGPCN